MTAPPAGLQRGGLSTLYRGLWVVLTVIFGLGGSVGFFVWAEGSIITPDHLRAVGCPWITVGWDQPLYRMAFNLGLMWLFGVTHSVLAQEPVRERLGRLVGLDATRAAYVSITGLTLGIVAGCWQPVGLVVWRTNLLGPWTETVTRGLYLLGVLASITVICAPRPHEFWGLAALVRGIPLETGAPPVLKTGGMYGVVRHPGYAALVVGLGAAPMMTADRMVMFVAVVSYLMVAIPVEEAKLVRVFGAPYDLYRRRVPALFPSPFGGR